jgi:hypothetical protein
MSTQSRRIEFYPRLSGGEPPGLDAITNAFWLISHGDGRHYFLQISGMGVDEDDARGYSSLSFDSLDEAKEYIKNLSKNEGLEYISMLVE